MKKFATAALAIALVSVAGAGAAQAGERSRTTVVYGPHGVTTAQTSRECTYDVYGTCTYGRTVTGAYGYQVNRSATTTQTAPGVYERNATVTGPYGGTASRSSTLTINR